MQTTYNTSTPHLEDLPLDIGYASEKIDLKTINGDIHKIGGQNGSTQIIISTPLIDNALLIQIETLNELLNINALSGLTKGLIVANSNHELPTISEWLVGYDFDDAYGDYYGVRLDNKELAKTLYIISKDGAVFYHEILSDFTKEFSIDKAIAKIVSANSCYTGKGCH